MTAIVAFVLASVSIVVVSTGVSSDGGGGRSGGPTKLQVTLSEMKLTPATVDAAASQITIEVVNNGAMPHNLAIPALDKRTPDLAAKGRDTLISARSPPALTR